MCKNIEFSDLNEEQKKNIPIWIDSIQNKKNIDESTLETLNIPEFLYKYSKITCRDLQQIKKETLYLSNPAEFNDPFDSSFSDDLVTAVVKNTCIDDTKHKGLFVELNKFKSNLLISCLSDTNKSVPMWAHYAQKSEGICIEYNIKKLLENPAPLLPHPVIYTNEIKNIAISFNSFEPGEVRCVNKSFVDSLVALIKSKGWSYEREWRFITTKADQLSYDKIIRDIACPISKIFIGLKTPDITIDCIKVITEGKNIELHKMKMSSDFFGLDSERIK